MDGWMDGWIDRYACEHAYSITERCNFIHFFPKSVPHFLTTIY